MIKMFNYPWLITFLSFIVTLILCLKGNQYSAYFVMMTTLYGIMATIHNIFTIEGTRDMVKMEKEIEKSKIKYQCYDGGK